MERRMKNEVKGKKKEKEKRKRKKKSKNKKGEERIVERE